MSTTGYERIKSVTKGKKPKLDRIVISAMQDQASINAFQNGQLDETSVSGQDRMAQITDMKGVRIRRGFGTQVGMYMMGKDGYFEKDGKTASLTHVDFGDSSSGSTLPRAQQSMAKEAGLKMTVDNRSCSDFSKTLTEGSYDVVAVSTETRDPFGYIPLFNGPVTYAVKKGPANYGPSGWARAEPEDVGWQKHA